MAPIHVLLTGSSRGIGAAIAKRFEASPSVRLVGHSTQGVSAAADGGVTSRAIASDFSEAGAACDLWAEALEALDGRIDVLINNAGIFEANPITLGDEDWRAHWERTMQINLTASAELCRKAVLHWRDEQRGGRIVNVASRAAYRGDSPDHWHYAASKAGMVGMTKSIARGYARDDILAFAICPGFTMTGMAEDYLESRGGDKLLADIPLGRVAEPAEIAEIAYFCAVQAPASMTGAVIDANGASFVR